MEMTQEQKDKIKKIRRRLLMRGAGAAFSYVMFLLFANLFTAIVDSLYMKSQTFVFFMTLGSAVIILTGLHGTIEEMYKESIEEVKKVIMEGDK